MPKFFIALISIMMPLSALAGESARKSLRKAAEVAPGAETDVNNHREKRGTAKLANIFDGADENNNQTSRKSGKGKKRATNGKPVADKQQEGARRSKVGKGDLAPGSMLGVGSDRVRNGFVPPMPGGGYTQSKIGSGEAAKQASSKENVSGQAVEGPSGNNLSKTPGRSKNPFMKETKENQGPVCDEVLGLDDGRHYSEADADNDTAAKAEIMPRMKQCSNNPAYSDAYAKGFRQFLSSRGCTYSAGVREAREHQKKGTAFSPHAKWCHSVTRKMSDMYAAGWTDVANKAKGIEAKAADIDQEEAAEIQAANERAEYAAAHPQENTGWGAAVIGALGALSDTANALAAKERADEAAEDERGRRDRANVANYNAQVAADNANANRNSTYTNHIGGGSSSSNSGGGGSSGSTSSGYVGCTKGSFVDSNGNACQ